MRHPEKWRDTVNPYSLPYKNFSLLEVIGYPHAGNDVFHVKGIYGEKEIEAYVKVARQLGADIENEINTIKTINCELAPSIIDYDEEKKIFCVSIAKKGERLSVIVGDNLNHTSLDYLYEYGQTLAKLHAQEGTFAEVKDRRFFHIPDKQFFSEFGIDFVYDYLVEIYLAQSANASATEIFTMPIFFGRISIFLPSWILNYLVGGTRNLTLLGR